MPIKSLEPFLFDNYSVGNYPIDILKNSTIGIDLTHYVSRLLTFKKEPFIELIGGFPITLISSMESDLKIFKELNVKPIFVIDGLSNMLNFELKLQDGLNSAERIRQNKWELFKKNLKIDTFRDYQSPLKFNIYDILKFFNDNDLEYIIAPYHSSQQLYYMLQQNIIDVIYGSTDLLLFNLPLEKYIFCIEFQNREFKFLDKSYILNRLNLNEKQFLEISMCCGNTYQPFNLNIFQPGSAELTFQPLHEFSINGGSIYNTVLQAPQSLQDKFFKGLSLLKFQPILNLKGELEISKSKQDDKLPNDLHEFIGQKLSNEYYYYQSLGLTNFKVIETILFGTYLERLPPTQQPHKYYSLLVNDVELINKILNLSTHFFNRYYQFKKYDLKIILPNNVTRDLELSRLSQPLYFTTRKFLYKDSNQFFQIDKFSENMVKGLTISEAAIPFESLLSNNSELLGSSIIRSFFILELINSKGELSQFGKILPYIKSRETLMLLIFFSKFNKQLTQLEFGSNKFEILSKILSIYHISNLKAVNYTNKISQSLLQFNSIFSKIQEQFNELVTANLLTILFNNEFNKKLEYTKQDWYNLVNSNPFNRQFNNTLLGVLSESFFTDFKSVDQLQTSLNNNWSNIFFEITPTDALKLGFKWYNGEFMELITKLLDAELLKTNIVDLFKEANTWLVENSLV